MEAGCDTDVKHTEWTQLICCTLRCFTDLFISPSLILGNICHLLSVAPRVIPKKNHPHSRISRPRAEVQRSAGIWTDPPLHRRTAPTQQLEDPLEPPALAAAPVVSV